LGHLLEGYRDAPVSEVGNVTEEERIFCIRCGHTKRFTLEYPWDCDLLIRAALSHEWEPVEYAGLKEFKCKWCHDWGYDLNGINLPNGQRMVFSGVRAGQTCTEQLMRMVMDG